MSDEELAIPYDMVMLISGFLFGLGFGMVLGYLYLWPAHDVGDGNVHAERFSTSSKGTTTYGRSYVVYTFTNVYGCMDVDGDKMDIIPLEVSYKDQLKVYTIQLICWSLYLWI